MKANPVKNIPNVDSDDNQWIAWRESLSKYGKVQANMLFLEAWKSRTEKGNWLNSSKANTEKLRDYLEEKGITLEKGLADYSVTFMDSVDDFFTTAFKIGKWTGIGAAIILVIIIIFILYFVAKNPDSAGKLAAAYATGGASLAVR